jgi:glycerol-3-phosphate dehydrogenase
MTQIGVIGGGAWGTALAQVAAQNGPVLLWAFETEVADAINEVHENSASCPASAFARDPRDRAYRRSGGVRFRCWSSRPPSICA